MNGISERVAPVLVLALGDPLRGDAGVGQWIFDALRDAAPWNERKVDFVDGDLHGRALTERLAGRRAILILEAIRKGAEPGTVHTVHAHEAIKLDSCAASELLASVALAGPTIANTVVIGIEPKETTSRIGLSPAVERTVPTAIEEAAAALIEFISADAFETGVSDVLSCSGQTY